MVSRGGAGIAGNSRSKIVVTEVDESVVVPALQASKLVRMNDPTALSEILERAAGKRRSSKAQADWTVGTRSQDPPPLLPFPEMSSLFFPAIPAPPRETISLRVSQIDRDRRPPRVRPFHHVSHKSIAIGAAPRHTVSPRVSQIDRDPAPQAYRLNQ